MSSILWLILAVFVLTLVGGVIRKLRKDPCLRFMHEQRVSFVGPEGRTMWGDMELTSQGFALHFDVPYVDERDLSESGAFVFPPELSGMIAVCRTTHGMTDEQKARRAEQVQRVLYPDRNARARRLLGNVGGMARDALVDTIGLLLGQIGTKGKKPVAAIAERHKQVSEVGGAILDLGARAYEPLLNRRLGAPVIVRIDIPGETVRQAYFPGYLADYNEKYLVVVNESLKPEVSTSLLVGQVEEDACARVTWIDERLRIACTSDDAVVVKRIVGRTASLDVGAVLLPGSQLALHLPAAFGPVAVEVDRTRRLDLVCPRARSQVRYISTSPPIDRNSWKGIGPIAES